MLILWRLKLVNSLTLMQAFTNAGLQYGGFLAASASGGNFSDINLSLLVKPIYGFGITLQFIKASPTRAIMRGQYFTSLTYATASLRAIMTGDPAVNTTLGAMISAHVTNIEQQLRGGAQVVSPSLKLIPSLKDFVIKIPVVAPLVSPARIKFQDSSKQIIQNIFSEHTARRYRYGQMSINQISIKKFIPSTYIAPIVSTQLHNTTFIGWTCLGGLGIAVTIVGVLYLFKSAEGKRYQNDEIVIDVTNSIN